MLTCLVLKEDVICKLPHFLIIFFGQNILFTQVQQFKNKEHVNRVKYSGDS